MKTPTTPLEDLFEFLRFASVSTDPAYTPELRKCAEWVRAKLASLGLSASLHETPGHPIVLARTPPDPEKRTVLIYGHYDVQPVDPLELWHSPPFEPVLENGLVVARGSTDNKGQILAHIRGVQSLIEDEALPVNVIFLVEGEEEIGSAHLEPFLREHARELKCDVIVVSDTGMVGPGIPTFTYGLRGLAALELEVTGPKMDLHSGMFGGAILNPATALARLLSTLHDDQGTIQVDGFFDGVRPLEDWERAAWAGLPAMDETLREVTGVPALRPEPGYSATESIAGRPTIEINGMISGYTGVGTKTVLPSRASAKITCRLVPNQNPAAVLDALERHFRKHKPEAVRLVLNRGHGAVAYHTDPHSHFGKAAQRALKSTWQREPALIREGGSIPIVQSFKETLGVDTLLLGLALPDCRAHSPNETFPVENLERGITLNRELLRELATV